MDLCANRLCTHTILVHILKLFTITAVSFLRVVPPESVTLMSHFTAEVRKSNSPKNF